MPWTTITTGQWALDNESALIETVQSALVEALGIPEHDRDIVLHVLADKHRAVAPHHSNYYTRVEIKLFAGRSLDTKRALYTAVNTRLEALGVPPTEINIILLEIETHNVGIRGGRAACDLDLGFKIDV